MAEGPATFSSSGAAITIDLTCNSPVSQRMARVPRSVQRRVRRTPLADLTYIISDDAIVIPDSPPKKRKRSSASQTSQPSEQVQRNDSELPACPICFEDLQFCNPADGRQVVATKCGHMFCMQCLHTALQWHSCCPVCCKKTTVKQLIPLYAS